MAKIKKVQKNGEDIYLVTHENAVLDSDGNTVGEKLSDISDIIGDTSQLQTNGKSIVEAMNEVFQCGNDAKKELVDALVAKGVSASTDNTWKEVTNSVKDLPSKMFRPYVTGDHTLFLVGDEVWSTGANSYGQLGLGDTTQRTTFCKVDFKDAYQVACAYAYSVIVRKDGTLWGCGHNTYGQLGLPEGSANPNVFTRLGNISNIDRVVCGYYHMFVLKKDNTVWVTGRNNDGQLGIGTKTNQFGFVQNTDLVASDIKKIALAGFTSFVLKKDGTLWGCGDNSYSLLNMPSDSVPHPTFIQIASDVDDVWIGCDHGFLRKTDNTIWSWGRNDEGQLGFPEYDTESTSSYTMNQLQSIDFSKIKTVYLCDDTSFLLQTDGVLLACGYNYYGSYGNGNSKEVTEFTPVQYDIAEIFGDTSSSGCFGLKTDGTYYIWGSNSYGQLGNGLTSTIYTPVAHPNLSFDAGYTALKNKLSRMYDVSSASSVVELTELIQIAPPLTDLFGNTCFTKYMPVHGASYGFTLGSDGYYCSTNKGIKSSSSVGQVFVYIPPFPPNQSAVTSYSVYLDCISYGENNYDFGLIGNLNETLTLNSTADSNVLKSFKGLSSASVQSVLLASSTSSNNLSDAIVGSYYVKYRKDGSSDSYDDHFKFKIRIVENTVGCCFDAGSQILLANGTTKNIEDIVKDDIVMSLNEATKEFEPKPVKSLIIKENSDDLVFVHLSNGTKIGMRAYHPLLTVDGWKSLRPDFDEVIKEVGNVELLKIGDILVGYDENLEIIDIESRPYVENYTTYNLDVEDNDNYVVDGIVAHNAACK